MEELSLTRRVRLHACIGQALDELYGRRGLRYVNLVAQAVKPLAAARPPAPCRKMPGPSRGHV